MRLVVFSFRQVVRISLLFALCISRGGARSQSTQLRMWESDPPADVPFPASQDLAGIAFTGRSAHYGGADTWYPSWEANGNLYSPWMDGVVNEIWSCSPKDGCPGRPGPAGTQATTGHANIIGDDPLHLKITDVGVYAASPLPYGGRYPAGSLVYNGIWFYGTYCLAVTPSLNEGWDILSPFAGFQYSTDYGKTWHASPHSCAQSLFHEPARLNGPVKLGLPHFVDFGKNMEYSPDGKAYIVSHGATEPDPEPRDANLSWATGDQIYLARVTPSLNTINDPSAYEYFAGHDPHSGALWTRDFAKIQPLFSWNNHAGNVSITYDAPLRKYLMSVLECESIIGKFNTYILESDDIAGPWRLVAYLRDFGQQGYFVNFPSKFVSKDGRTLWMSYSAIFTNGIWHTDFKPDPPGGGYWWALQEVRLLGRATPES